jgi:hypothetical protein
LTFKKLKKGNPYKMDGLYKDLLALILKELEPTWKAVAANVCTKWRSIIKDRKISTYHIFQSHSLITWAKESFCPWSKWTCYRMASIGDLVALQRLRANNCPWDANTPFIAAKNGNLAILEWVVKAGCPVDATVCAAAAEGGHIEVLKWLRANNCPWDKWTCICAGATAHFEILAWAIENGCSSGQ